MEAREINRYKSNIIFNIVVSFMFLGFIYFWILPKYSEMDNMIATANSTYNALRKMETEGLTYNEIKWMRESLPNITESILKDQKKVEAAIKKTWSEKNYLEWINLESTKQQEYSKKRERNNKIIGNIIPVLYNDNDPTVTEKITLGTFIQYVEEKILNEYNIENYNPLWLENISFKEDDTLSDVPWKKSINSTIGSFTLDIELKWKNSDILKMINFIQNSWIVSNNSGELDWNISDSSINQNCPSCSALSNLLITIDNLELKDIPEKNEKENSWKITLRFYVRSLWFEQFKIVQSKILERINGWGDKQWLDKKLQKYSNLCNNTLTDPICTNIETVRHIEIIKKIYRDYSVIKKNVDKKVKELKIDNLDIDNEIKYRSNLNNSLNNIEVKLATEEAFINNFKNKWQPKSN